MDARLMPNGSVDWHWFNEERARRDALYDAGICPFCGERESAQGIAVCGDDCSDALACEEPPHNICSFCGRKFGTSTTGAGSMGSPTWPISINHCPDCGEKKIPELEEAEGQGRML